MVREIESWGNIDEMTLADIDSKIEFHRKNMEFWLKIKSAKEKWLSLLEK